MEKLAYTSKTSNKVDILSMLSEAHGKYHEQVLSNSSKKGQPDDPVKSSPVYVLHKPHPIKASAPDVPSSQHSANLLEDLFQSSKTRDTLIPSDERSKTNGLKSLVQKLAQNGGNATPPGPSLQHSLSFSDKQVNNLVEGFLPLDVLEKNLDKKLSLHHSEPDFANLPTKSPLGMPRGLHEQAGCITPPRNEQSNSLVLMSPMVFSSSKKDRGESEGRPSSQPRESFNGYPMTSNVEAVVPNGLSNPEITPLTKTQLSQAISYLLKSDPEFVHTIHDAYVKSMKELTSRKTS